MDIGKIGGTMTRTNAKPNIYPMKKDLSQKRGANKSMTKRIFIAALLFVFFSSIKSNGQIFFVKQIGHVVFNSSSVDSDSSWKIIYTTLINEYIQKHYQKKKLPLIYLTVYSVNNTLMFYELAYDNLNGNSLENEIYDRKGKYDAPGIRIKICSQELQKEELLKLLNYGINNLKELKKIRNEALKKSQYDQPNTLSLSQEKILEIINHTTKTN